MTTSLVNSVICNFWDRAGLFYKALSESWGCACRYHHRARLILQHRTTADQEFQLHLFHDGQGAIAGNLPSAWRTAVSGSEDKGSRKKYVLSLGILDHLLGPLHWHGHLFRTIG